MKEVTGFVMRMKSRSVLRSASSCQCPTGIILGTEFIPYIYLMTFPESLKFHWQFITFILMKVTISIKSHVLNLYQYCGMKRFN